MGDLHQEGPADTCRGLNIPPSYRAVEALGLAPEGAQYLEAGLLAGEVETILSSRAPSTRKLYCLKWNVFTVWFRQREVDLVNCSMASVLELLQERFSAGLTPSILKVYVAAIAAFHTPLSDGSLGRHQLVVRFLRGAWWMRPATRIRVPTWDLAVVLEGFTSSETTNNPTTSFTSSETTNNPTTSFTSSETTNNPTTIFTPSKRTGCWIINFTPPETTNNPTTSFTSSETTNNPTTSFTSSETTNNPSTSFTSSETTNNPTTSFTSSETTGCWIFSFTPPETCYNPTTSFTSSETTYNSTTSITTPKITYNPTTDDLKDKDGFINPSKASEALNNLESKMEEMEHNNISSARIVMGDVIGLLHIQDENTENRETCYSSDANRINVTDCQSDLKTDIPWSLKIPSEAFNKSRLKNHGCALLGVLRFKNMGKDETKNYSVLNNEVYGITMKANISNLTNNTEMFFTQKDLVGNAYCSSWDGKGNLAWTTSGCKTVKIDNNTIKCSCSHLTFFAVLMSPPDVNTNITAPYVESLSFITSIGCGISMFFQTVALFMHFLLRKAKSNQATKILINMFVALFILNLSFLSNESVANTEVKAACVFIALLMHYSMLTTFTWFFIQALHMYLWLIRQNVTITNYMRKITVFGWTFPAPIVVAVVSSGGYKAVIINATSGKTTRMCWITDPFIHYIVNIGYYALVFIFTTGIFIMIVTNILQARHIRASDGKRNTFRKQLMMVLSLFLLFGLTWAVAFFSYGAMIIPSYYIFTVLNSFQGFFLFLYYYHIHNDVAGYFSDDPENSSSTITIVQSRINVEENI
ncbi:adhesion G-protein coupled receptor G1-like [Siphateles boraxobius]|uniref:adhesion G-protein coupled receptor G1-like n=1 Tax=Siphateles boraxobius TaxID=180520 RepID=UPI00406286D0